MWKSCDFSVPSAFDHQLPSIPCNDQACSGQLNWAEGVITLTIGEINLKIKTNTFVCDKCGKYRLPEEQATLIRRHVPIYASPNHRSPLIFPTLN
jgi:hypothetical protein